MVVHLDGEVLSDLTKGESKAKKNQKTASLGNPGEKGGGARSHSNGTTKGVKEQFGEKPPFMWEGESWVMYESRLGDTRKGFNGSGDQEVERSEKPFGGGVRNAHGLS